MPIILRFLQTLLEKKLSASTLKVYVAEILAMHSRVGNQTVGSPHQIWINGLHLDPKTHRFRRIRVSSHYLLSLQPWRDRTFLSEVVITDASLSGWGTVWEHRTVRGLWTKGEDDTAHKCAQASCYISASMNQGRWFRGGTLVQPFILAKNVVCQTH